MTAVPISNSETSLWLCQICCRNMYSVNQQTWINNIWQWAFVELVSADSFAEDGKVKLPHWAWRGRDVGTAGHALAPPGTQGDSCFSGPMWSCCKPSPAGFSSVSQEQWAISHSHNSSPHLTLSTGSSGDIPGTEVFHVFYSSLPFINLSLAAETRPTIPS